MIGIKQIGEYNRFQKWCESLSVDSKSANEILKKYGQLGVDALAENTPKRTGLTSRSWKYKIEHDLNGNAKIVWYNTNIQNGQCVALLIFNGHGTSRGVWVEGRDYINPAMQPVFDEISESLKREVFKT